MSAFLGPIHYWLYRKIQIQEGLLLRLLRTADKKSSEIENRVSESSGIVENGPLGDVIDTGNIHGWLENQIRISERRLANGVSCVLKEGSGENGMLGAAEIFGKETAALAGELSPVGVAQLAVKGTPAYAYKLLTDVLLDGMPCDMAFQIKNQDDVKIEWRRTADLHSSYWKEEGIDFSLYDRIRGAFIRGLLSGSGMNFIQNGNDFVISRTA